MSLIKPNRKLVKPSAWGPGSRGFALVVTLSLMILLTVIAVGLLTLSAISLRTMGTSAANARAQANARMAMMLAIGDLQKAAGKDQIVTGTATLGQPGASNIPNPAWAGVWSSEQANSSPHWLVSGDQPDPTQQLKAGNSVRLSGVAKNAPKTSLAATELRASWVKVTGRDSGRYAYWIGDEGTKAKVDITRPAGKATDDTQRMVRSQSPLEADLTQVDKTVWVGFEGGGSVDKQKLATMGTAALAATESAGITRRALPQYYLHDLTTGGFGLPVNVKNGGMKSDLSLVLDRSQKSKPLVSQFIGASPASLTLLGANIYNFPSVTAPEKFYLSDKIRDNLAGGVGPNWGILYNYAHLWEMVSGNESPLVGCEPRLDIDLRQPAWGPYVDMGGATAFASDTQHITSGVSPVISVIQLGLYLGARAVTVTLANGSSEERYQAELRIKPIVGLWNPYNVNIKPASYKVETAMLPYLRLDYQKPNADGSFDYGSGNVTEMWMRDYWASNSDGKIPTDSSRRGGSYLRMLTDPVDFQPGEFRLFSVSGNPVITDYNKLTPTLDMDGSYKIDIIRTDNAGSDPVDQKGQKLRIKGGFYAWFGDVFLQDTHWDGSTKGYGVGTRQHLQTKYGQALDTNAATSWLSLKGGVNGAETHLQRVTNIWNGGQDETSQKPYMPEPIRSARSGLNVSGASGKNPQPIELLAQVNSGPGHIGTWRFYLRNPTEVSDPSQGSRGWVDSNPRVIAANLRFDGSKNDSSSREGWNAISNLVGAADNSGQPYGTVGDGEDGDRGLVSEGQFNSRALMPQGVVSPDRWLGYGGGSSSQTGGHTHVIAYDVPRTPLVSIAQFQHAELSRYNFEPGFVVANSYANPRIPLNATITSNFSSPEMEVVDSSYEVNRRLWDQMFFSSLAPDYVNTAASSSFDSAFDFKKLTDGTTLLPNPRMIFSPQGPDTSLSDIIDKAGNQAPAAMASRILINGCFNVNSTSKTAWKAILSSMGGSEMPVINPENAGAAASWERPEGVRFNRFGTCISNSAYKKGDGPDASFWQGWRELSEPELDLLADKIVSEVESRGPFRSMADFVNRDPTSAKQDHQRKGALQAALDQSANNSSAIPSTVALPAQNPVGAKFSSPVSGENQAVGHAGYLMQGDVLQSLAPILQVRSDYFRIRTCGEALDESGKVLATAYCEAFVQRVPDYLDGADHPEIIPASLTSQTNRIFGRRFILVSFRWLSANEI